VASNFGLNTSVLDHTPPPALTMESVAGVMVSIVAFQAVDPGSIPGPRTLFFFFFFFCLLTLKKKSKVLPRLELGFSGSKPDVLTNYTIEPILHIIDCVRPHGQVARQPLRKR
jgi:hypothetical protein